jgi:glycerol-3-phosphate acyltransferase PlsY
MGETMTLALGLAAAYVAGSLPFGWIVPRLVRGIDIREHGSGNPGATNVARVVGIGYGLLVGLLDFGKGWVGVETMLRLSGAAPASATAVAGALAAVAGHNWPIWTGFRGGKGVLTSAGAFAHLAGPPLAGAAAVFVAIFATTRMVSAGSMAAAAALPILVAAWPGPWRTLPVGLAAGTAALLVAVRHRANVRRILAGTEPRVGRR